MVAPRDVRVLQKKEGGGQDLSPCPGGSGSSTLTYLLIQASAITVQARRQSLKLSITWAY